MQPIRIHIPEIKFQIKMNIHASYTSLLNYNKLKEGIYYRAAINNTKWLSFRSIYVANIKNNHPVMYSADSVVKLYS